MEVHTDYYYWSQGHQGIGELVSLSRLLAALMSFRVMYQHTTIVSVRLPNSGHPSRGLNILHREVLMYRSPPGSTESASPPEFTAADT